MTEQILQDFSRTTDALSKLSKFYIHELWGNEKALRYLRKERQLSDESIREFGLGLAPQSSEKTLKFLDMNGIDREILLVVGVLKQFSNTTIDFFSNRIIFPIRDLDGSVTGLSGRVWGSAVATDLGKYVNTSNSPSFKKSLTVYGLYHAHWHIRSSDYAVLVEGNLDTITLHRAGIKQAICTLSCRLGENQARLIGMFTSRVVCIYDGDVAGVKAGVETEKILNSIGVQYYPVKLEDGYDPDKFVLKKGEKQLQRMIAEVLVD